MPIADILQPEIIEISPSLRLRCYDGDYMRFLPAYRQSYICHNSEGIFDESKFPDEDYLKRMCSYLSRVGELYYIEALENGDFAVIGDVTVKDENPPVAVWWEEYRGRGIGKTVMRTVIRRLFALGYGEVRGSTVYKWNLPSQRMHEVLGFHRVSENEREIEYALAKADFIDE